MGCDFLIALECFFWTTKPPPCTYFDQKNYTFSLQKQMSNFSIEVCKLNIELQYIYNCYKISMNINLQDEVRSMSKRIAYIRVSSEGQNTSRQDQQIEELCVDKVFTEKASGRNITDRPQFQLMLEYAREDDHIYCADLTRWGRSLIDIKTTISDLTKRSVSVTFLKENLTFTGKDEPMSNLLLGILSSLAEWERSVIKSRQMEGVRIAQQNNVYKERCGRKPKLTKEQINEVKQRVAAGEARANVAKEYGVSRQTVYVLTS